MPQPLNNRQGEQWDSCDQCGLLFPMSRLIKQKGLLICTRRSCFDDLEIERRQLMIMQILGTGVEVEGADLRVIDRGFFEGFDETDR